MHRQGWTAKYISVKIMVRFVILSIVEGLLDVLGGPHP